MAQIMHVNGNGPEKGQRCPSEGDEKDPYQVETPYGYQLDLDFLKYVNDIERGNTIKRLSIQRRPKVPRSLTLPRGGGSGGGVTKAEWTSTDSLSSSNSDDKQSPVFFQPRPLLSAPLTPVLARAACELPLQQQQQQQQQQLLPPPSPRFIPRHNPQVERTLMETRLRLEQERLLQVQLPGDAPPRRRLGSGSSLSSYSGSVGPSQLSSSSGGGHGPPHPYPPVPFSLSNGDYNPYYPASAGGSMRHSPLSSGVVTPVTNVSPLHLQQIREQMVVALRRLKELEEQVRTIPILQVKIAVLQEEKRQLAAQSKSQGSAGAGSFRKRSYSVGSAEQMDSQNLVPKEAELLHIQEPEAQQQSAQRLEEFRRLAAEVQALEETSQRQQEEPRPRRRSIGTATDQNMNHLGLDPAQDQRPRRPLRDVGVSTERRETRNAAVGVTEAMLGTASEAERELELQQQTIEALKDKIYRLEVALKETTHQVEMGKLKLQLQAAGGSGKKKADKGVTVRPETFNASVEARVQTRSQAVGDPLDLLAAAATSSLQTHSVGVSCRPNMHSVAVGPEVPMDRWVVRQHPEVQDQQEGTQVSVREVGCNTEEHLMPASREQRSVGCGDSSPAVRTLVSRGTDPEVVCQVDAGVTVAPERVSRQTGTEMLLQVSSKATNTMATGPPVEASTNTRTTSLVDASTSTRTTGLVDASTSTGTTGLVDVSTGTEAPATRDQQTNTVAAPQTRTVGAGEGLVKDPPAAAAKTRSVGVGTSAAEESPRSRECGVGGAAVQENFLVGLKTRSIACGPSQPHQESHQGAAPGPVESEGSAGLDHYIERVQKLLQEQQMLLSENYSELAEAFGQPQSQFGSISSQLVSTLSSINSVMKHGSTEDILELQADSSLHLNKENGERLCSRSQVEKTSSVRSPAEKPDNTAVQQQQQQQQLSAAEQKSRMDLQMSTALHGQPCSQNTLKSIMKKKDGRPDSNGTKKNLQFVGVNGGYETTSSDDSSSEDSSSSGSEEEEDEEEEEEEKERRDEEQCKKEEEQNAGEELQQEGAEDVDKQQEEESTEKQELREKYELSEKMVAACNVLKTNLSDSKAVSSKDLRACLNTVQHEWFRVSSQKAALAAMVDDYLEAFGAVSPAVLRHVVNMADGNGNTALHYSVSHSNFQVVKKLLDADVCNVNQQNKAGYTPIMLAALAAVESPKDMHIVEELFSKGDVNARASQAGQTGLMLAVSHGRMDMVQALLGHGADVNVQDDEGSTALMCASEHGHVEIVKLLLAQPGCDATLSDSDESNALSIALEAGHKDIAVLLYAHVNFSKAQSPGTPRLGRKTSPSPTRRSMFD
ncbi:KN motif and ankyrin repeat domain-containing protein 1a isoform X2 [Nelusetta ayraudi]|uniref:KN motif and ankyrin repeat domain-containing protein 1a isoform X2 n=1 Tax=Nelusetta ayraudi TaxID=303726 RepID=UPI003F6F5629